MQINQTNLALHQYQAFSLIFITLCLIRFLPGECPVWNENLFLPMVSLHNFFITSHNSWRYIYHSVMHVEQQTLVTNSKISSYSSWRLMQQVVAFFEKPCTSLSFFPLLSVLPISSLVYVLSKFIMEWIQKTSRR